MNRSKECRLCGKSDCIEFSEKRGYCFRFGVAWILRKDTVCAKGGTQRAYREVLKGGAGGKLLSKVSHPQSNEQETFEFVKQSMYDGELTHA